MPQQNIKYMEHICFFCHSVMAQTISKNVIEDGKACVRNEYSCPNCNNVEVEIIPSE